MTRLKSSGFIVSTGRVIMVVRGHISQRMLRRWSFQYLNHRLRAAVRLNSFSRKARSILFAVHQAIFKIMYFHVNSMSIISFSIHAFSVGQRLPMPDELVTSRKAPLPPFLFKSARLRTSGCESRSHSLVSTGRSLISFHILFLPAGSLSHFSRKAAALSSIACRTGIFSFARMVTTGFLSEMIKVSMGVRVSS